MLPDRVGEGSLLQARSGNGLEIAKAQSHLLDPGHEAVARRKVFEGIAEMGRSLAVLTKPLRKSSPERPATQMTNCKSNEQKQTHVNTLAYHSSTQAWHLQTNP